ncbi:MAG: apolipoprotein N-acyltransferase [Acidocella sp. 20-57-95]|nr:MAG: apolipoprotein N-acyltransferase [Acidocella sp. 20-57-95]OYV62185.1 MAG: apolipoprotein N-acyltransferase [Acidocella sp. 21-58-7]HQT63636.1 apolipoprotein N-acyltransferase [Acidocella sp.]HQU04009.1 apolipoprotein N-acyltransferase [Acidocella sp.]
MKRVLPGLRRGFATPYGRAFLWGLASALALPPVHLLPVLLLSIPAFLQLIGQAKNLKQLALIAWLFGFGTSVAGLYWITEPILTEVNEFWWLVPFADPLLAFAVACYSIIPAAAAYYTPPGLPRLLVFAGAWVASDILRQYAFSGFPWNLWGTDWAVPGQFGDVFIQLASLVGVHGMTLATILLAGTPLFGRRGLAVLAACLLAWGGFGVWRLSTPTSPTGISLALVQPDFSVPGSFERSALLARWARLEAMSAAGLHAGATAVIWPEAASPWLLDSDAAARSQLAAVTGTAPILAGSIRMVSDTDYRNALVVTHGPLPAVDFYDKWKLVPFGEYTPAWIPVKITPGGGFTPGNGPKTLNIPGLPPVGPLICYEAIFSGQIVDEAHRPAWLVNVTDDAWFGDSAGPRQHFADARLRAVEEGLPLARDANSGISAMFDAFGRVTASLGLNRSGVLVAPLPGALPPTLYSKFGLAIPECLALLFVLAGLIFGRRRAAK